MGQLIYPDYFAIYAYNAINECAILGSKDGLIWEELQRWVGGCTPYNDGTTGTASGSYQTRYLLGSGNDSKALHIPTKVNHNNKTYRYFRLVVIQAGGSASGSAVVYGFNIYGGKDEQGTFTDTYGTTINYTKNTEKPLQNIIKDGDSSKVLDSFSIVNGLISTQTNYAITKHAYIGSADSGTNGDFTGGLNQQAQEWTSNTANAITNTYEGEWIQVDMGRTVTVKTFEIYGGSNTQLMKQHPAEFKLFGSNTGSTGDWTEIFSKTGIVLSDYAAANNYRLDNAEISTGLSDNVGYKIYRLAVSKVLGETNVNITGRSMCINELVLYGFPTRVATADNISLKYIKHPTDDSKNLQSNYTGGYVDTFTFTGVNSFVNPHNSILSGNPVAPTQEITDNSDKLATTKWTRNYIQSNAYVSPNFTGIPKAPTAAVGTNTTQIATTEFVKTAVDNLIDGAPAAMDTLNELAAALNDNTNFAATVTASIQGKQNQLSATNKLDAAFIGGGNVSTTEFDYLDGVTSSIQTQLDGKQLPLSATNKLDAAFIGGGDVSTTEFDYLNGVTSAIQTQLDSKGPAIKPAFQSVDLATNDVLLKFTEPVKDVATYDKADFSVKVKDVDRTIDSVSVVSGDVKLTMNDGSQTEE